jgi:hypothetical protein
MPLHAILAKLDQPAPPEITRNLVNHMKGMPDSKEELVLQCATYLEENQTLGAVLAVVHALNDGDVMLRCNDDDDVEKALASEFDSILGTDKKE